MCLDQAVDSAYPAMERIFCLAEVMPVEEIEVVGNADQSRRQLVIGAAGQELVRGLGDEEMICGANRSHRACLT